MNKDWLWKLQMDALESRAIGSDACRLLLLLCKRHHRNLCSHFPEPFKLSMADAVAMLGYSRQSEDTGYKIVRELIKAGFLEKRGVTGCPPTSNFIISKCRQPTAIKSGQPTAIKSGQPTAIKSGQPTAIKSGQPTAIKSGQPTATHISSSFQEEIDSNGSNSSHREVNSSLRSSETSGKLKALPPAAKYLTKSQIAEGLHALSQLRSDSERKTKTGTAFKEKK